MKFKTESIPPELTVIFKKALQKQHQGTKASQNMNVPAERMVQREMAALAKSGSPFISLAITYVTVAVGDANRMIPGK